MTEATLQSKVNRILIATFVLVFTALAGVSLGYSHLQNAWAIKQTTSELTHSIAAEVEGLFPSFLLPEQQGGTKTILERIKSAENLTSATILDTREAEQAFKSCLNKGSYFLCTEDAQITVAVPIRESERVFAYLVKSKSTNSQIGNGDLLNALALACAVLFVAFIALFGMLARLISREIPMHLNSLLKWIEDDLQDRHSDPPNLQFKELNHLGQKISEIFARYDLARDQAVVGQLTSGIMHDIKTPLSSIVAATCLAQEQAENSPKRLSRLENLLKACESRLPVIGQIVESTLDGSREIHIEKTPVSLRETVLKSIDLTQELVNGRNASVTFADTAMPIDASHDSLQLTRVFTNLIKNALESAQSQVGTQIYISVEAGVKETKVSFEDNGPGISGDPNKVFRVFRSTKAHGSGLGLLVSRKIVEAHSGRILAGSSSRFGGARFDVYIPKNPRTSEVSL
jgi:signal transduction histidine kinase